MRIIALLSVLAVFVAAALAVLLMPSDRDHAAATTPEMLAAHADRAGAGELDGLRFDTTMGPEGGGARLVDFVQFNRGLFMSKECEDRCNYPPSAHMTRTTSEGAVAFIVEAFCPTKNTTMVWRGQVLGDRIDGKVQWASSRLLWKTTATLTFEGRRSADAVDLRLP